MGRVRVVSADTVAAWSAVCEAADSVRSIVHELSQLDVVVDVWDESDDAAARRFVTLWEELTVLATNADGKDERVMERLIRASAELSRLPVRLDVTSRTADAEGCFGELMDRLRATGQPSAELHQGLHWHSTSGG